MIVKQGSKYTVTSEDGSRKFGSYKSEAAAKKRLAQVEYFKSRQAKSAGGRRA